MFEPTKEKRTSKNKQHVGQDGTQERQLHNTNHVLPQRHDANDHLRGVSERCIQQSSNCKNSQSSISKHLLNKMNSAIQLWQLSIDQFITCRPSEKRQLSANSNNMPLIVYLHRNKEHAENEEFEGLVRLRKLTR